MTRDEYKGKKEEIIFRYQGEINYLEMLDGDYNIIQEKIDALKNAQKEELDNLYKELSDEDINAIEEENYQRKIFNSFKNSYSEQFYTDDGRYLSDSFDDD